MSRFRQFCLIVTCLLALIAGGFLGSVPHDDGQNMVVACDGSCWDGIYRQLSVSPETSPRQNT
jgi:hypothetical protein